MEGLRIWTRRPFFQTSPATAIQLIAQVKSTARESEYLARSIGNALRDIRKKHRSLVDQEVSGWDITDITLLAIKKLVDR